MFAPLRPLIHSIQSEIYRTHKIVIKILQCINENELKGNKVH